MLTEKMIEAGTQIADDLFDSYTSSIFNDNFVLSKELDNVDLIESYLNEEITSVSAIYLAMERAKEPQYVYIVFDMQTGFVWSAFEQRESAEQYVTKNRSNIKRLLIAERILSK